MFSPFFHFEKEKEEKGKGTRKKRSFLRLLPGRHRIRNVNYKPGGFVREDFVRVRGKGRDCTRTLILVRLQPLAVDYIYIRRITRRIYIYIRRIPKEEKGETALAHQSLCVYNRTICAGPEKISPDRVCLVPAGT
jgi:hypothetical protein